MDHPLDRSIRVRRLARGAAMPLLALLVTGGLLAVLPGWVTPSFDRDRIRTARVRRGPVEATITASGIVVPAFEQVIASPIASRVVRVLHKAGAVLTKGEPILELDLGASALAVKRLDEELALKRNQQERLRIALARDLQDLDARQRLQRLDLQNLRVRTARNRALLEMGAVSQASLGQVELAEARAVIELERLRQAMQSSRASIRAQLDGLALEIRILDGNRQQARRRLQRAGVQADRDGVLTWVVERTGVAVSQGEEIARLADLSSFRVEATVSQVHVDRLRVGLPVKIDAGGDRMFTGHISRVLPTVNDGVMTIDVALEDAAHVALRAQQRVDVYLVTERRERVLTLDRGPFLTSGSGKAEVFVVHGDVAVRTSVRIGISSYQAIEVIEGLQEGDEVVVSDVSDYQHRTEVDIR